MSTHTPPIVPHVLYVADQSNPWKLAPIERLATRYHTPTTVATAFGTIDFTVQPQKGKSGVTKQQYHVWCLPDDAAWQRVQACRSALQKNLDLLAGYLRLLGCYAKRLDEAGGMKKAPNPLTATVISAPDPDNTDAGYWFSASLPRIERKEIGSHTPKMLHVIRDGRPWSTSHQRDHFVCPGNDHWQMIEQRHAAVQAAYEAWQLLLRELGTYQDALGDGRHAAVPAAAETTQEQIMPKIGTTVFSTPELPAELAGWRWSAPTSQGELALMAPDGWATKGYRLPDRAIAEAQRRVLSQPKPDSAPVRGAVLSVNGVPHPHPLASLPPHHTLAPTPAGSAPAATVPTVARNAVWHNLPPLLAGWRWIGDRSDVRRPPVAQLESPDGWHTVEHEHSNPAIAEALRHLHSQPKSLAALIPAEPIAIGVAMMDAAEARETLDGMREDLGQADKRIVSFRQRAAEFADREGWAALGYKSSTEAINVELGEQYSKSYLSRLLKAAKLDVILELPMGNSADVPERVLRPLGELDTPDQQKQAWQQATAAAGGARPTAGQVQEAVDQVKPKAARPNALPGWVWRDSGSMRRLRDGRIVGPHPTFAETLAEAAQIEHDTTVDDVRHMQAIEQILVKLDQWADSARSEQIHAAYSHARAIRDPALRTRAFTAIDRALDSMAVPAPEQRGQPHKPVFTSIHDEMNWLIGRHDWAGAQALIDGLPGGAMGARTILAQQLEKGRASVSAAPITPESRDADGPWFWASKSAVHPTAHCWHRSAVTGGYVSACGIEVPQQPTSGGKGMHCGTCETHADRREIVPIPGNRPPAAPATNGHAVPRRPLRPASADVSATLTYLDQLEIYADAQDQKVAELERRLAAPIRWIRIQLATCRMRIVDGTADVITAAELDQLAEDLEQLVGDDSLPDTIYESLARQIGAAQRDLRAAQEVGA